MHIRNKIIVMKKIFALAKKDMKPGNKKLNKFTIKTMLRLDGAITKNNNKRSFNKAWTSGVLNFEG